MKDLSQQGTQTAHGGPSFLVREGEIVETRQGGGYARLRVVLAPPFAAPMPEPGQFFMVRLPWGPALPRALSPIAAGDGWIELFIKADGLLRGEMAVAPPGTRLALRGPYGTPFVRKANLERRYVLVGGGAGVAPILHFAAARPDLVASLALGFRTPGVRALLPGADVAVEEEDGTTAFGRLAETWQDGLGVIACGPLPLLAAVSRDARWSPAAYVSLEARLGCGFGACLGCTISTPSGRKRVCVDGPLFACQEVPWLG